MAPESVGQQLKEVQRDKRGNFNDALGLRVHRAISWFMLAEEQQDQDAQFIFLWIAFNAAYANETLSDRKGEQEKFNTFLKKIIDLDRQQQLYTLVWSKYSNAIRILLDNKFVFQPYWDWANGLIDESEWIERFEQAKKNINQKLAEKDTAGVLKIIFTRLYTLRNQLMHGGATHSSKVNRDQLRDADDILLDALPILITNMMDHPETLWGDAIYPAVSLK